MSAASDMVELVKVKDSVLDIKEKILYPVSSGASQVTSQTVSANSKSASNLSFNIVTPNESTVISRHVLLDVTFSVRFSYPRGANPDVVFKLGDNECPCAFPFQGGFVETIQCYLNNTSISTPLSDILHERWLATLNSEEYASFEGPMSLPAR